MLSFKRNTLLIASLLLLINCALNAQADFQFTLQTWGTYTTYDHGNDTTTTQLGFGLRRARLRGKMTRGKATGFVQFDAASATITDAQIDYSLSEDIRLRMGRFVGPGSQAGGRTSHTAFDFAERSIVGRLWAAAAGRADYRSYGLAIIGKTELFGYEVMASNGDGSLNLKPYNIKSSNSNTDTGVLPQLDLMVTTSIVKPLQFGLHYGLPNADRINVSSLTGFAYMRPEPYHKRSIRGKMDFARVVDHTGMTDVTMGGYQVLGFYKLFEKIEIGAGYASWDPDNSADNDAFGNVLFGLNYFPDPEHWRDTLFKLVLTLKTNEDGAGALDPLIIHLIFQLYLH